MSHLEPGPRPAAEGGLNGLKPLLKWLNEASNENSPDLLFGVFATHVGFIDDEQLTSALEARTNNKCTSLAVFLLENQALNREECALIEALVVRHRAKRQGFVERNLAVANVLDRIRDRLRRRCPSELDTLSGQLTEVHHTGGGAVLASPPPIGNRPTSAAARFRIIRPHAKGGLGDVFVAEDVELHREVALKQIQEHLASDADSRARFVLEAEITGGLEHPGIVPVYGLGSYADGRPFYAMRFIRGQSLRDAIERFHSVNPQRLDLGRRMLEFRQLLGRFIDVCNAIEFAHSRGVLHRDLKPGNIMLGNYGETLVVDWGLAKPVGRRDGHQQTGETTLRPAVASSTPTQMGSAVGTPQYMSPEQAQGRLNLLGPASDVYSLGATLYCLLTGRPPLFEHSIHDIDQLVEVIQSGDIRAPRQVKPDIPKPLEAICRRAMATDQAARYRSPRELADDLEHWLADESIAAMPDTWSQQVGRWARQHRAMVQSAAAALLAVTIIAIVAALFINDQRQQVDSARQFAVEQQQTAEKLAHQRDELAKTEQQSRRRADEQAALALSTLNTVIFDIQVGLADIPGAQALRRKLLDTALNGLQKVARTLDTARGVDRSTTASRIALGDLFSLIGGADGIGGTKAALQQYQFANNLANQLAAADPTSTQVQIDLSVTYERLGQALMQSGNFTDAREAIEKGLGIVRKRAEADPKNAQAERELWVLEEKWGDVNLRLGNVQAAHEAYERGLTNRMKQLEGQPSDARVERELSVSYEQLADADVQLGRVDQAHDSYQKALKIRLKRAEAAPDDLQAQRDLGISYERTGGVNLLLGSAAAARDTFQNRLGIALKLAAADPSNTQGQRDLAVSYQRLGDAAGQLGDTAAAQDAFQRSLEIALQQADADRRNAEAQLILSTAYQRQGDVAIWHGNLSAAREAYQKALGTARKLTESDPHNSQAQLVSAIAYGKLADVSLQMGQLAAAGDAAQRSLDIAARLAKGHRNNTQTELQLSVSWEKIGDVALASGTPRAACDAYQKGLESALKVATSSSGNAQAQLELSVAYERLGSAKIPLGDKAGAVEDFKHCLAIALGLAQAHPHCAQFERELSVAYEKIGDGEARRGNLPAARDAYQKHLEIIATAAETDVLNLMVQLDYSGALEKCARANLASDEAAPVRVDLEKSLEIAHKLAKADANNARAQRQLSMSYLALGDANQEWGKIAAAKEAYEKGLAVASKLSQTDPDSVQGTTDLARLFAALGLIAKSTEQFDEAAAWLKKSVESLESLEVKQRIAAEPLDHGWLADRRRELAECEQAIRAINDANYPLTQEKRRAAELMAIRGRALARRGKYELASETADKLAASAPQSAENAFRAAEIYSLSAAGIKPAAGQVELSAVERATWEHYSARAVELIKAAEAAGFFHDPSHSAAVDNNHNFDAIRQRADFRSMRSHGP